MERGGGRACAGSCLCSCSGGHRPGLRDGTASPSELRVAGAEPGPAPRSRPCPSARYGAGLPSALRHRHGPLHPGRRRSDSCRWLPVRDAARDGLGRRRGHLGAVAVFLIARTALGEPLRARAGPWLARMEQGFRDNALSYLLVLRLVPIFPFWLVNLVPAFLGVGLGTYALATCLGIVPGTLVYASVGNGLGAVFDQAASRTSGLSSTQRSCSRSWGCLPWLSCRSPSVACDEDLPPLRPPEPRPHARHAACRLLRDRATPGSREPASASEGLRRATPCRAGRCSA